MTLEEKVGRMNQVALRFKPKASLRACSGSQLYQSMLAGKSLPVEAGAEADTYAGLSMRHFPY